MSPTDRLDALRTKLGGIADPAARRQAAFEATGEFWMSEPEPARVILAQLCEESADAGDTAMLSRAAGRLAELLRCEGLIEESEKLARQALTAARECRDEACEATTWNTLGLISFHRGEYARAQDCYQRCLEQSRNSGYIEGELAALTQLGTLRGLQGRVSEALDCYQRCLAIDREHRNRLGEVVSRINIGWMLEQLGRWEEAAEQFYRAIAISEQYGFEEWRLHASCNLGELFIKRNRLNPALDLFGSVIEAERGREPPRSMLGIALMHRGRAMFAKGDFGAAGAGFADAAAVLEAVQDRSSLAALWWQSAELALQAGRLADAEEQLGRAAGLAAELGLKREAGEVLRVRGLHFIELGEHEAARDCFERSIGELAETPEGFEMARVCLQYGRYLAARGETVRARALLRQAAATFRRLSVVAESEEANRLLLGLDLRERGASAVLAGLQGLERVGLEPAAFVREALRLLHTGLGFAGATLKSDSDLLAGSGDPNADYPDSRPGPVIELDCRPPVRLALHRPGPDGFEPDTALLAAVSRLLADPVSRLLEARSAARERSGLAGLVYAGVIGRNKSVLRNLEVITRVADTNVPVLVRGESGTGKELVARAVHDSGARRGKPFCAINCAAVPEGLLEAEFFGVARGAATGVAARKGKFELSAGGTVFLDEIGDMSPGLQAKLLRVLQESEFEPVGSDRTIKADVRFVAATNQDMDRLLRDGLFRTDLYYRLNAVEVVLPPLRERKEDIPELTRHFIRRSNAEFGRHIEDLDEETLAALLAHDWPGNIRELQHIIERAVILCRTDRLRPEDLPIGVRPADRPGPVRQARDEAGRQAAADIEKTMLLDCLKQADWKVSAAARLAGFSRAQFYRLLKRHNIKRPKSRTD